MSDETQIPLLDDLIQKGEVLEDNTASMQAFNESGDLEIEPEEQENLPPSHAQAAEEEDLIDDASVRELIIDEEIRMILDKHMDEAYQEIIRLLNHRIS